jgi:thiol-disulfide isomerase/thioredoxin
VPRRRGSFGWWVFAAPGALAALLAAGACGPPGGAARTARADTVAATPHVAAVSDSELIEGVAASDPLPSVRLPDLNNVLQPLHAPEDDVTVVNFWASWCTPCLAEIPQLVAFHDRWKSKRVRVVGVAVASGNAADIRRFAVEHHMDYDLLVMDESAARRYFGRLRVLASLPITLVVDHLGVIRRRFYGPHTEPQFAAAARATLVAR